MTDYEARFTTLLKEIGSKQYVRESLPTHSKYYEGLLKKVQKQNTLKQISEEGHYDSTIKELQSQLEEEERILTELREEKKKLDGYYMALAVLYNEVMAFDVDTFCLLHEQQLKKELMEIEDNIRRIEEKIKNYKNAQWKYQEARDRVESTIESIPGIHDILDRLVLINHKRISAIKVDISAIKKTEEEIDRINTMLIRVNQLCPDIPILPPPSLQDNTKDIFMHCRDYRLKIETILRTHINPTLSQLEGQLTLTKYKHDKKHIEWTEYLIVTLESYLRDNDCLHVNVDKEINKLKMNSVAAHLAMVALENNERVTVDDVLEVMVEGCLPEYDSTFTVDQKELPPAYFK